MSRKRIGDDRREAIDWLQDRLGSTRTVAETAMIALLRDRTAITTSQGIMLSEDDDEVQRKVRASTAKSLSKASRIGFRRTRASKMSSKRTGKIAKTDFSMWAEHMILAQEARAAENDPPPDADPDE